MRPAFFRLFSRSWSHLMMKFSMSTTGFIALSCVLPVLVYLALIAVPAFLTRNTGDGFLKNTWNRMKSSLLETGISVGVVLIFWVASIGVSMAYTLYDEHQTFVETNARIIQQVKDLTRERDEWKDKFEKSEKEPRAFRGQMREHSSANDAVTAGLNERCWLSNLPGFPNSKIEGAVTANAAIIHCNHKVEAPYLIQVEFDRDFIPGATTVADGSLMQEGEGKNGLVRWNKIIGPALLSDQTIIVMVYGKTDQYPRAKSFKIETLK